MRVQEETDHSIGIVTNQKATSKRQKAKGRNLFFCLSFWSVISAVFSGWRIVVSLAFLFIIVLLTACQPSPPPKPVEPEPELLTGDGRLYIHALDVGQGDGFLIISPSGKTVLIDAGPTEAGDEMLAALARHHVKVLDLMVATHPHADHIGGMRKVINTIRVKRLLDSGQVHSSETYARLMQTVQEKSINFIKAQKGQTIDLESGAKLEVLNPGKELMTGVRSGGSVLNANSVVLRLGYGEFGMLFTGDAEFETEAQMMNEKANLAAQVLKIGHHGSRYATSGKFLETVRPQTAIISDGAMNEYGHPSQFTLDRLRRAKVQTYRTDLHGEITIVTDSKNYEVKSARRVLPAQVWLGRQPIANEFIANP
jgi:beta-lactamase superfamily II metal-dependent hydrolase